MQQFFSISRLRIALVATATIALGACSAGSQQVTPSAGAGLTPLSAQRSASSAVITTGSDSEGPTVAYDSIPSPLKAVSSIGFEATQGLEFGDGVNLTHGGKLLHVRYVLSSWACQTGRWYSHDCATSGAAANFPMAFTLNVYAVDNAQPSHVGALLTSRTNSFNIPYRPSSNASRCPGGETFFSRPDNACVHGLANVIEFDMDDLKVTVPNQIIVSLSYNTTHYGPHPIGESAPCYTSSGGCGYDSLNVSADGNGGPIGSPVDPNGVFASFTSTADYCAPTGLGFRLDTPCWTGEHPQMEIDVAAPKVSRTT